MATATKFKLLGSSLTGLDNGPSQPPAKSFLSFHSSTPRVIRLRAKQFREVGVIVRWGGDGGGGGSDGDGDGEGEAEDEWFEKQLPMLGSPWSSKDQEVEGSLGWPEMKVQLYGFEFDDGFFVDDIFSMKNAAEYRKYEEKMLKELEIAADLAKATGANVRFFYLLGPVSLSPPIEVNAGSMAEIMYSCPDKELQNAAGYQKHKEKILKELEIAFADVAKARVANLRLFDLPGPVSLSPVPIEVNAGSIAEIMYARLDKDLQAKAMVANLRLFVHPGYVCLSPSIEVNAGSTTAILYACPDKELQADVDGEGALKFVFVSFHPGKLANDELLKKAFAFFDQNKSGHIGLKEVINATAHCSTQIRCISMMKPVQIEEKNPGN